MLHILVALVTVFSLILYVSDELHSMAATADVLCSGTASSTRQNYYSFIILDVVQYIPGIRVKLVVDWI